MKEVNPLCLIGSKIKTEGVNNEQTLLETR